jgi:hypothetical protein
LALCFFSTTAKENTMRNAMGPLRKSPLNPRYFAKPNGEAVFLAGSHNWYLQQDFIYDGKFQQIDFNKFVEMQLKNNHNIMRYWLFALQEEHQPYAPKKICFSPVPYKRVGKELAFDGKPKFDLTEFDNKYFDRLKKRVEYAREKGIYVSIVLFDGYAIKWSDIGNNTFDYHPYNINNNVNGVNGDLDKSGKGNIFSLEDSKMLEIELLYVKKVIDTVSHLDNVLYEICNEVVDENYCKMWEYYIIDYIKEYERSKGVYHPVGISAEGYREEPWVLTNSNADWFSPGAGLNLEYRYNPPEANGDKVIISDTDHLWGLGGTPVWAWKSFVRGLNLLYMDPFFNFQGYGEGVEKNDPAWSKLSDKDCEEHILMRKQLGYIVDLSKKIDLNRFVPKSHLSSTNYCLADEGKGYIVLSTSGDEFALQTYPYKQTMEYKWLDIYTGVWSSVEKIEVGNDLANIFQPPKKQASVLFLYGDMSYPRL